MIGRPGPGPMRFAVPMIVPYDSFARDIFGVLNMEGLVNAAEAAGVSFLQYRDEAYTSGLTDEARVELRAFARSLSPAIVAS